jgi:hypothetical protein
MNQVLRRVVLLVFVLTLASNWLAPGSTRAAGGASLVDAPIAPGLVDVGGAGFTPGGRVYVALYDVWGATLHQTMWTAASATVYGPGGSEDPARGYRRGGAIDERFDNLCGANVMARAYDSDTKSWTDWITIDTSGAAAVYGPDGSQDPALGYRAAC